MFREQRKVWLLVLWGASGFSCAPPVRVPKNVLIISLDTARRDAFGFMGRENSPSPNLDRLAAESIVFDDAYTTAPLTLPAHASLLTGLYPAGHGLRDNGAGCLPAAAETLAETLGRSGWRSRAAVAAFVLDPCFGLDQGFESYSAPPREPNTMEINVVQLRAKEMIERAMADLDELSRSDRPFFYWLHLYDPHAPFDAPGTTAVGQRSGMSQRDLYEAEIRYADRELGKLFEHLKRLGLWEDLIVAFVSDHGEGLDDGKEKTHGFFVFDQTVRIPLVLRHPDLPAGRFAGPVSIVDIAPTLLGALELGFDPRAFDGVDLGPRIRAEADDEGRLLVMESYESYVSHGWAPFRAGVRGPWKYIRSRRRELYDREVDPLELRNVWDRNDDDKRAFAEAIEGLFVSLEGRLEPQDLTLDSGALDALSSLGYVGSGAGFGLEDELDFDLLADPYDKYPLYERMLRVSQTIAAGDVDSAIQELRTLARLEPDNPLLLEHLGELLVYRGVTHLAEAERSYARVLELRPGRTQSRLGAANCSLLRSEEVRRQMERELSAGREASARALADQWRTIAGRAIDGFRRVLSSEESHPTALHNLGTLLTTMSEDAYRRGEFAEAKRFLQEAHELTTRLISALSMTDARRIGYEKTRVLLEQRLQELR
ncbi:MAG: hypothetical protein CMJ89_18880 [Planctomycetes bacterium]|nr:hypothetical protein [Planctomycetota bacterium]